MKPLNNLLSSCCASSSSKKNAFWSWPITLREVMLTSWCHIYMSGSHCLPWKKRSRCVLCWALRWCSRFSLLENEYFRGWSQCERILVCLHVSPCLLVLLDRKQIEPSVQPALSIKLIRHADESSLKLWRRQKVREAQLRWSTARVVFHLWNSLGVNWNPNPAAVTKAISFRSLARIAGQHEPKFVNVNF